MHRDAQIVEDGDQLDSPMVQSALRDQDEGEHQQQIARRGRHTQKRENKLRATVVDAGLRGDQAENIEPGDQPAGARTAEIGRPVIHGAGGRISRTQLGHAGRHGEREQRRQGPAQRHFERPAHLQPVAVKRHSPGENRNDGKRDGEVGKTAHAAEQFLGVSEAAEIFLVGGDRGHYKLTSSFNCLLMTFSMRVLSESPDSTCTKEFSTTSQSSL